MTRLDPLEPIHPPAADVTAPPGLWKESSRPL